MAPFQNHYTTLSLQQGPLSTPQEIRRAYFTLARTTHPDKNPGPSSTKKMQALVDAYEVLSDPTQKRDYDVKWNQYQRVEYLSGRVRFDTERDRVEREEREKEREREREEEMKQRERYEAIPLYYRATGTGYEFEFRM
jgi:curved DNA-binding protein CbpA